MTEIRSPGCEYPSPRNEFAFYADRETKDFPPLNAGRRTDESETIPGHNKKCSSRITTI